MMGWFTQYLHISDVYTLNEGTVIPNKIHFGMKFHSKKILSAEENTKT